MAKVKTKVSKKVVKVQKDASDGGDFPFIYVLPLLGGAGAAGAAGGGGNGEVSSPTVTFSVARPEIVAPAPTPAPAPSPVPAPVPIDSKTLNFKYVDNAFVGNMPLPGKFQVITTVAVVDVNNDGYKDIVIHAFEKAIGDKVSANLGDVPTLNKISILINNKGMGFSDDTSKYVVGNPTLSGASRKVEVVDINNDGIQDIIFACNREDGRSGQQYEYNTGFMNVMLSTPNGYEIEQFGEEDWYHSAGYAILNGVTYVAGAGHLRGSPGRSELQGGYSYSAGDFVENVKFPFQLSPNNFIFFESANSTSTDRLIQTAAAPNWLGVEGWEIQNGEWVKVGQFDTPGTFIKNVTVKTYNGNVQDAQVYKLGDDYIIVGMGNSITESAKIDINNTNEYSIVMKLEAAVVNNFDPNTTTFIDNIKDVTPGDRLVFYTIKDGKLVDLKIEVADSTPSAINATTLNVIDINNDGYDDIVLSSFTKNGLPEVYLNDKDGSFTAVDIKVDRTLSFAIDGFSIIDDFNNDGIMDLVSMPGNGQYEVDSVTMSAFAYYTGVDNLSPIANPFQHTYDPVGSFG